MREIEIGGYDIRTQRWFIRVDGTEHWFDAGPPWDGEIVNIGAERVRVRLRGRL